MPPYVIPGKCDACQGEEEPLCVQVCPGDLMVIDPATNKAVCRDPGDCWDCMICVKSCTRQAIQTVIQYQLAPVPAKLIPLIRPDSITWTLVDCQGHIERFVMKTLTGEEEEEEV